VGENDVWETPGTRQHKAWPTRTALAASVVICTRDRPDTIGRAVESVASQSATSFDVLVVDQSRSNETQRIVQEYMQQYPHVRYLHLDRAGLSHAYNIGIKNTSGAVWRSPTTTVWRRRCGSRQSRAALTSRPMWR